MLALSKKKNGTCSGKWNGLLVMIHTCCERLEEILISEFLDSVEILLRARKTQLHRQKLNWILRLAHGGDCLRLAEQSLQLCNCVAVKTAHVCMIQKNCKCGKTNYTYVAVKTAHRGFFWLSNFVGLVFLLLIHVSAPRSGEQEDKAATWSKKQALLRPSCLSRCTTPTVGLEPTTTRLRALHSTD